MVSFIWFIEEDLGSVSTGNTLAEEVREEVLVAGVDTKIAVKGAEVGFSVDDRVGPGVDWADAVCDWRGPGVGERGWRVRRHSGGGDGSDKGD